MSVRLGFRHCDPRFGFLWRTAAQPAARWHAADEGPANCFADTPEGAWAEFLRHEGISEVADLVGVRRSLWAVELPGEGYSKPTLASATLTGGLASYVDCQTEARRLRAHGATRLEAPSAALMEGGARGWVTGETGIAAAPRGRDGRVWVLFGRVDATGWIATDAGAPPAAVLPRVRPLQP